MGYDKLRKGRYSEPGRLYFVTAVTHHRRCWFEDLMTARMLVNHLRRLHATCEARSLAWVIMPDHLHWLFRLGEASELHTVVKRLKAASARDINRRLNRHGSLWQKAYHDHALRADEDARAIARYIVANPLRAGLVRRIGDYPHWDATWLGEDDEQGLWFD